MTPARVSQHVSIIRPSSEELDPNFLHYQLIAESCKERLLSAGEDGGSTRQALTKAKIEAFAIVLPQTVEEQRSVVLKVGKIADSIARFESIYARKLAALDELKKSLLHEAFNGRL